MKIKRLQSSIVSMKNNITSKKTANITNLNTTNNNIEDKVNLNKTNNKVKDLTFMFYLDGSNNLVDYITQNVQDIEAAGSTDKANYIVQLSRFYLKPIVRDFFAQTLKYAINNSKMFSLLSKQLNKDFIDRFKKLINNPSILKKFSSLILYKDKELKDEIEQFLDNSAKQLANSDTQLSVKINSLADKYVANLMKELSEKEKDAQVNKENTFFKSIIDINKDKDINNLVLNSEDVPMHFIEQELTSKISKTLEQEPKWEGIRRYEIGKKDKNPQKIDSKVIKELDLSHNMADPKELTDFIVSTAKKYPAKHYVLLMSDHGAGWLGAIEDRDKFMSLKQIKQAITEAEKKANIKIDVLVFDACLMGQIETAYALKDTAKNIVFSEEEIGGVGMPYTNMLKNINRQLNKKELNASDISKILVDESRKVNESSTTTMTAVDTSKIDKVAKDLSSIAERIIQLNIDNARLKNAIKQSVHFAQFDPAPPYKSYIDLGDLLNHIKQIPRVRQDKILMDRINTFMKDYKESIIAHEHVDDEDYKGTSGYSIYAPRRLSEITPKLMAKYRSIQFSKDTMWDDFIVKLLDYAKIDKNNINKLDEDSFVFLPHRG